jgi:hypothetical protein
MRDEQQAEDERHHERHYRKQRVANRGNTEALEAMMPAAAP